MYKPDQTLRQQFDQIADNGMTKDGRAVVDAMRIQTEALLGPLAELADVVGKLRVAIEMLTHKTGK